MRAYEHSLCLKHTKSSSFISQGTHTHKQSHPQQLRRIKRFICFSLIYMYIIIPHPFQLITCNFILFFCLVLINRRWDTYSKKVTYCVKYKAINYGISLIWASVASLINYLQYYSFPVIINVSVILFQIYPIKMSLMDSSHLFIYDSMCLWHASQCLTTFEL